MTDTSVTSRLQNVNNKNTLENAQMFYKKSISSLRNHTAVALDSLASLESGNVSQFDANKKCEKAIQSYESEMAKIANKIRVETMTLQSEEKNLEAFLDAAMDKFERWEKSRSEEGAKAFENDRIEMIEMPNVNIDKNSGQNEDKGEDEDEDGDGDEDERSNPNDASGELTIQQQVARINGLIRRDGGSTGHSWHEDEHRAFLKCWTKVHGNTDVIVKGVREFANATLSQRGEDEIINHAAWYVEYVSRCERKKVLASEWRTEKERERTELVGQKLELGFEGDKENYIGVDEMPPPPPADPEMQLKLKLANDKKKAAVSAWKEGKEAERERERLEEARLEEQRELEREKEMERHRYLRGRVNQYKVQKVEDVKRGEKLKRLVDNNNRGANVLSKEEVIMKRKEELLKAKQKRETIELREREKKLREERVRGVGKAKEMVGVERDFSRLTGGTKASEKRAYRMEELDDRDVARSKMGAHEKKVGLSGRDLNIGGMAGKRATPSWRAKI